MESNIEIRGGLFIPVSEVTFTASRSSGPGGQNVNKVNTRITLLFDVVNSASLSEHQKALIARNLSTRVNKDGQLRVIAQKHRSQAANKAAALERFAGLLEASLQEKLLRKKTVTPKKAKERRLQDKEHRSRLKSGRAKIATQPDA